MLVDIVFQTEAWLPGWRRERTEPVFLADCAELFAKLHE